ncbi:MAG: phytanoyl-CoA dioxygenase family protein [Terricaulis sp.]
MADCQASAARTLPHLSAATPAETITAALMEWGAVIIDAAAPIADLDAIDNALTPWFERTPRGEGIFLGRTTRRFSGLFAKAESTSRLAVDPLVLAVVEQVLMGQPEKRCDAIQLNLTQAIAIDPGQGAQPMHRDASMYPFAHDFELIVNVMWPLDDFTAENGATRIAPKSHLWEKARRPQDHEIAQAIAPAGSVILWLGSTLHGGGENRSAGPRRGLVFNYCLGWLSQAEKLLLSTPPHIARRLPTRLQRLLGYQVHRPSLGWIEERDPIEWLNGEIGAVAAAQDHFTPELEQRLADAYRALEEVGHG